MHSVGRSFLCRSLLFVSLITLQSCGDHKATPLGKPSPMSLSAESSEQCTLKAGFSEVSISPNLANNRPIWLAGFGNGRRATHINDDLKAIAMVVDDGVSRVGIVGLDAIGYMHNDVEQIRAELPKILKVDYLVIASTHNHEAPDLIGIWGKNVFHSGVDAEYRKLVRSQIKNAVTSAIGRLKRVCVSRAEIPNVGTEIIADTRQPQVFDPNVYLVRFTNAKTGETEGNFVTWANHVEVLWDSNTAVTADYPGYLRSGVSEGLKDNNQVVREGVGGITLFLNGAIGGLQTTLDSTPVPDPFTKEPLVTPSFAKARAVGYLVANAVLDAIEEQKELAVSNPTISFLKKNLTLSVDNLKFRAAAIAGLIPRKFVGWFRTKTEVAVIRIGDVWIATAPGELYPELVNGGVQSPPEGDFYKTITNPVETPPIRSMMRGKMNMVISLANDQIGYLIPKSQWDSKKPWAFGETSKPYGEENSLGPNTAPAVHAGLAELFRYL